MSFNCDGTHLVSVGGPKDGCMLVVWSMNEGKSECFQPASDELDQDCTDVAYFNNTHNKFITVHQNAVKIWTYDAAKKKVTFINCAMGKIKRYITCVSIDPIDEYAYCGTRSGDIMEVSLSKGIYSRSGPIDKKLPGTVNQVISKFKVLYVGTSEGSYASVDKKSL